MPFPLYVISSRLLLELYLSRKRDTVQPSVLQLVNGEAEQTVLDVHGAEVGMPAATCEVGCLGVRQGKMINGASVVPTESSKG